MELKDLTQSNSHGSSKVMVVGVNGVRKTVNFADFRVRQGEVTYLD